MKTTSMKVVFCKPNNDRSRIEKLATIKGKITSVSINKALDKVIHEVRKNPNEVHTVLYNYDRIELDDISIGYCPKCKKEIEYHKVYGDFDGNVKCSKRHKILTNYITCTRCDDKMWEVSSRSAGEECIITDYKCFNCGKIEHDVLD
jgi:DNA-directed RNA polymerase subunit RPC12/RpoP